MTWGCVAAVFLAVLFTLLLVAYLAERYSNRLIMEQMDREMRRQVEARRQRES